MGLRGPLRDPNSRRGQQEMRKRLSVVGAPAKPVPVLVANDDLPACDPLLPPRVQEIYGKLVAELAGAKVPVKQIDAHVIVMAARAMATVENWEAVELDAEQDALVRISAGRLKQAASKDLIQWLQLICATPGSRARIGLKPPVERKGGRLAEMLAQRQVRKI